MSMHKKPLTELERRGLHAHCLPIEQPSQLSDAFRAGMAWAGLEIQSLKSELEAKLRQNVQLMHERDAYRAAEEAQIALRAKADERIAKLEGMRARSRKERAQLREGIAALQAHVNYMEEIYKQWNRHEIDDKQFLSLLSILINRLPSASLAIRDAEQQRIGAASFRHELHEASSVVIRPHIQGVFEVWLRQQAEGVHRDNCDFECGAYGTYCKCKAEALQ